MNGNTANLEVLAISRYIYTHTICILEEKFRVLKCETIGRKVILKKLIIWRRKMIRRFSFKSNM